MGHKTHPIGFRIGITEDWRSRWCADKANFGKYVVQDELVRRHVKSAYHFAGIPRVDIERTREQLKVILYTARPGIVIGRKGSEIDKLKEDLQAMAGREVQIKIEEITKPEFEAQLVAENIVEQLEKRTPFRRVMKRAAETAMQAGAKGIKIQAGGRLGGAEIARSERVVIGSVPLHTLRADISYGFAECKTSYGRIGVKVWIYRGPKPLKEKRSAANAEAGQVPQEPAGTR